MCMPQLGCACHSWACARSCVAGACQFRAHRQEVLPCPGAAHKGKGLEEKGGGLHPISPTDGSSFNAPTRPSPCSCRGFRNGKAAYKRGAVKESNFKGNGTVLGGLLIFQKAGKLVYRHAETDFGVHPPMSDVIQGAERAAPTAAVAA